MSRRGSDGCQGCGVAAQPKGAVAELLNDLRRLAGAFGAKLAVGRPDSESSDVHRRSVPPLSSAARSSPIHSERTSVSRRTGRVSLELWSRAAAYGRPGPTARSVRVRRRSVEPCQCLGRIVSVVATADPVTFLIAVALAAAISAGVFAHASRHAASTRRRGESRRSSLPVSRCPCTSSGSGHGEEPCGLARSEQVSSAAGDRGDHMDERAGLERRVEPRPLTMT